MSLTIRDLTEMPHLRTRILAGASGGARPVMWAHTCELPEPWQWLGTGDLLLTDGYSFPRRASAQADFIVQLAAANLSGMALAEGMRAAPLTSEAARVADELSFPVLQTAFSVPFVSLARTVAESNSQESGRRLHRILRIYDILRRSTTEGSNHAGLLERIASEIGSHLAVLDLTGGHRLLDPSTMPEPLLAKAFDELGGSSTPLPAFSRVPFGEETAIILPLQEKSHDVLVALPRSSATPDLVVLQHVVAIASMEVERRAGATLRRRVDATRILQQLAEGVLDGPTAIARVTAHGLGAGPWLVVAIEADGAVDVDLEQLHARIGRAGLPHLLLAATPGVLVLMDAVADGDLAVLTESLPGARQSSETDADNATRTTLPPRATRVGVSREIRAPERIPDGVREARWALEAARRDSAAVLRYGDQVPMFMPSTLAEGETVVARVLGELIDYDTKNAANLMETLGAYLEANRSVQQCAQRLAVHKQTVVYRMRRIEEITGRRFQEVGDLTALYLAFRTWQLLTTDGRDRMGVEATPQ